MPNAAKTTVYNHKDVSGANAKRVTVRHTHHCPLRSVNPREHPDVEEGRAAFENAPEFKERPPAPATDVGEEGNCVAAD